jgi:hypothetical protein
MSIRDDHLRIEELIAAERFILDALDDAYRTKRMRYLEFSPAWDVGQARIAAMTFALADMKARSSGGNAITPDQTEPGA